MISYYNSMRKYDEYKPILNLVSEYTCPFFRVFIDCSLEIRQKLYSSSIGQWRKYAKYLEPMKREFLGQLPYLKKKKALVFDDVVNWEMKEDFDYETYRSASNTKTKKSTEKKNINKVKGKKLSSDQNTDKKTSRIVDRNEFWATLQSSEFKVLFHYFRSMYSNIH